MLTLRQPHTPDDHAVIRQLCRAYRAFLAARVADRPELVENYYSATGYEAFLARLPALHARPDGAMFLADWTGAAVGCAMTRRIDTTTCEIKRVFVSPAGRGRGVARALVGAAMDQARADGYRRMVLDTMVWLSEAIALYQRLGFTDCAPFYPPDPAFAPDIRFFARPL